MIRKTSHNLAGISFLVFTVWLSFWSSAPDPKTLKNPAQPKAMKKGISRKRPALTQQPSPANPPKQHATSQEDEFLDEDVFLDETLFETEDDLILRDIEERQALASRLTKWARPSISHAYISASRSIGPSSNFAWLGFFCNGLPFLKKNTFLTLQFDLGYWRF